jgi:hypothetical protein
VCDDEDNDTKTYARNKLAATKIGVTKHRDDFYLRRGNRYLHAYPFPTFEYYLSSNLPNAYGAENRIHRYFEDKPGTYKISGEYYAIWQRAEIEAALQVYYARAQFGESLLAERDPEPTFHDYISMDEIHKYLQRGWITYKQIEEGVKNGFYIISNKRMKLHQVSDEDDSSDDDDTEDDNDSRNDDDDTKDDNDSQNDNDDDNNNE